MLGAVATKPLSRAVKWGVFGVWVVLSGCTSTRMNDDEPDRLFRRGLYEGAAQRLEEGVRRQEPDGDDLLLYLLDWGLALHQAEKYEQSNQVFLRADKIAEIKDYTSLSDEAATLLTSENIKDYSGEDFEKVLINAYLAMNFALMGKTEEALVEARRVNHKLYLMVTEGKRNYQQSAFARYLSAVLYESDGNWNDAYIDYQKTWELMPQYPGLGRDLWRMAWLLRMRDQMERWDQTAGLTESDHHAARELDPKKKLSEIVVIYENGISPRKRPHETFFSIPVFKPRFNPVREASVVVDGVERGRTVLLQDIEATAIQNLDDKYAGIIAKKLAGVVAKEVVADQIGKHTDPMIGFAAKMFFYFSDQADIRSWNLLPRDFQMLRVVVPPGKHVVRLDPVGANGLPEKTVDVAPGKKVFVNFRYIP